MFAVSFLCSLYILQVVSAARVSRNCGNGICRVGQNETCVTCPEDCGPCFAPSRTTDPAKTLKLYFLFGQSNMQGHACPEHLKELATNPATSAKFGRLYNNDTGEWAERSDVFIRDCNDAFHLDDCSETMPLRSVGFGVHSETFGPETGFGWRLGNEMQEDIFLCKVAWGGKDISIDFRPPSSTKRFYNGGDELLEDMYELTEEQEEFGYSFFYNLALEVFYDCIENVETYAPGYDKYEPSGIVYFQAWNDLVSVEKVGEYEYNLRNLLKDFRSDLGFPELPFVVGESGQHTAEDIAAFLEDEDEELGQERYDRVMGMRRAQRKATKNAINADLARTSRIVDSADRCPTYADGTTHEEVCGCPEYHYYNNAQIYYDIGAQMADKMLSLDIFREFT
jgi:hypothetical protein